MTRSPTRRPVGRTSRQVNESTIQRVSSSNPRSAFRNRMIARVARAPAATLSESERAAVAHVRAESIKELTAALAAPEMQGRGTGQPGGERAAQFIAERFRQLGLK